MHAACASRTDATLLVPADTIMPGATSAISLAIMPEGFTSLMTFLQASPPFGAASSIGPPILLTAQTSCMLLEQVHRPPPLPIIIVPLDSQGDHPPELLQRSLWLGVQAGHLHRCHASKKSLGNVPDKV